MVPHAIIIQGKNKVIKWRPPYNLYGGRRISLYRSRHLSAVYANYIGPSVMTDANKVIPVKNPLYVMIKLLKMTDVS